MSYLVTYMLEGNKEIVQRFENEETSDAVQKKVCDLLKTDDFVNVSPGYYGTMFGETYLKSSKIIGYVISKDTRT